MILALSLRFTGGIHRYLYSYAPSNNLIRHLRSPDSRRWAFPISAALTACYLAATAGLTAIIGAGGPDWLNLVVLTCAWNAIKFAWLALASAVVMPGRLLRRRPHPDRADAVARA